MAGVTLVNVSKRYGDFAAIPNLSLDVRDGEFLTLLGPSGCGKTTTLRMVAGLVIPDSGQVIIGGRNVTRVPPERRRIGMVFQDYALFPHLTIAENVTFGLRERGVPKSQWRDRMQEMLGLVRLTEQMDKYPHQLSGGQRQRVALARALAYPPEVLLMDEPLGALDLKLRQAMQLELMRIQRELAITVIYVTHDQEEALNLSDRIAVINQGRIEQLGSGPDIYNRPVTPFVADFLGRINLFNGRVRRRNCGTCFVDCDGIEIDLPNDYKEDSIARVGIRPEKMSLSAEAATQFQSGTTLRAQVETIVFAGNLVRYCVRCTDSLKVWVEQSSEPRFAEGDSVLVTWHPSSIVSWLNGSES